jgi:hypothetical protein
MHATHQYETDKFIKKHRFNPLPKIIKALILEISGFQREEGEVVS